MRILHTSDWHVGRTIRGRSREDEHRAVLAEIAGIVRQEGIDLVLVAGDVFDTTAPSSAAEEVVYEALLDLTRAGGQVVVVSGNHDNGRRFTAVKPFLALARVHALGELARPEAGGCIDIATGSGEIARVALLPWVSQRGIVRAEQLMELEEAEQQGRYQQQVKRIIERLCSGFGNETVNLLTGHLTVTGAAIGGGERSAETIFDYWVPPQFLPDTAHYCALGHIHRRQRLPHGVPAWYSGSPLQLDFGEAEGGQGVLVFEAKPSLPVAEIRSVQLREGRPLVTVAGTLAEIQRGAGSIDPRAYVRVRLDEIPRAGLAESVYEAIPNAVRVEVLPRERDAQVHAEIRGARSPRELYANYLDHIGNSEPETLLALFDDIVAEVSGETAEA